jgi:hypothetical protein
MGCAAPQTRGCLFAFLFLAFGGWSGKPLIEDFSADE